MKNNIFKNTIPKIGTLCFISLPIITAVSCGSKDINFNREYDFSKVWDVQSNGLKYVDAKIDSWIDGDTLKFTSLDFNYDKTPLRVAMIDTPETHEKVGKDWVDTKGKEYEWGKKAESFGKTEIPVGTTVRLVLGTGATYGRIPGSIFYGKNFSKSYSYEIIKKGLALPFYNSADLTSIDTKWDIMHYLALPIADAYNYANQKNKGLFGHDLSEILKTHGSTATQAVRYKPSDKKSAYYYQELDFWT